MPAIAALALLAAALPNAVVLLPVANMYSKPSLDADVVSQAIYGANVAVLEQQPGWARIRTADEYTGWMQLADLRIGAPYATSGRVAHVSSLFANIYRDDSVTKHAPLLTVPIEARLEVSREPQAQGRWMEVKLADGRAGWVQRGDVVFDPKPLSVSEMLEFARRFIGLPYAWGGTSTFGYDCSGFMQMLGRRRGVNMPRDAQPQADWNGAAPVERKDLRPGDLLYFGSDDKHITHTGMYVGDGKFISATVNNTPTVHVEPLADPHWSGPLGLVAIRRVK